MAMTAKIVDVRETVEFESSHVNGAVNIPLSAVMSDQAILEPLSINDEIILYCNTGNRSGIAMKILKMKGFKRVKNGINQASLIPPTLGLGTPLVTRRRTTQS